MDDHCPCCSGQSYADCCGLLHGGKAAATAEALMRSRYCAFVKEDMGYLAKTMRPPASLDFDVEGSAEWAQSLRWLGLKVIESQLRMGGQQATVEFVASFVEDGEPRFLHERSLFKQHKGRWYYVSSRPTKHDPEEYWVS
jgi:SEC-C motif-containing protein